MTRPAIVIGLGGTGQWVLTFLKKDLLEIGGGVMPAGVRLIAFDTTSTISARAGQASGKTEEDAIRAGSVELIEGKEFIPIGENTMQLATEISAGKYDCLRWFPAKSLIEKLPGAAFNTKDGSGQIRQMGRISIFRDLSAIQNSKVLSHLRHAMQELQNKVSKALQLEIIIIGSLAGGTGAGMLVDLAYLVRAQASRLVQENYVIRGFFVLPRAFTRGGVGEDRDMLARSFACWRELDRFMIVSERFGLRQINYHDQNSDLRLKVQQRAYDVSYMVDPARQTTNSLENIKAEEGLFPSLAHCISAILDNKAGKAYTEFVTTNLAGKLSQLPRGAYHSAIGSYTLKVPVYYAKEKFSHQLALDVLERFLAPEVNQKNRVVRLSEIHNREVPEGYVGRRAVLNFTGASSFSMKGQEIPNTRFLPLVAEIREKEGQREASVITQVARGGLTHVQSRFLLALTDISQDEEGKLIVRDITDELNLPIWREIAPSRMFGDTPDQAYTRIKNKVPDVRHEHYGMDTASGERLRGKYGKALERAKAAQVARFQKLLQAWTLVNLNGQNEDLLIARCGKLGFVRTFYEELCNTLIYFIGFLDKVHQERNETLKLASRSKEAAQRALVQYDRERGKRCWVTFWDDFTHPDAHRAQRNYLMAEQRDIDVRKDDVLLDVLAETATEMQAIAKNTLDEIDNWIAHLATGDPSQNLDGLYHAAVASLDNVNVNHELDKRLGKVSEVIGEHEYKSQEKFITDALRSLQWKVDSIPMGIKLGLEVESPHLEVSKVPDHESFSRTGENPTKYNLDLILKLAERPYQTLHKDRPIAREIVLVYETGTKLALAVDKKAEPLYTESTERIGPEIVACYIRVKSDLDERTTAYFREFEKEMKDRNPNIKGSSLTLVESEDPHKITIVRSNDLLPSTDFEMWHACRQAYIKQITDPSKKVDAAELHIFPSEINACYYEAEMPRLLGKNYRTLHPEVVALLEDRERFEMFMRALALNFVREEDNEGQPYWIFQLTEDSEPLHITLPSQAYARKEEDIFQVIHNFVLEGRDQRPGMGQQRWVDWTKLREAIRIKQRELGKNSTVESYQQQIEGPNGLVKKILNEVEIRRTAVQDENLRKTIAQEYEDLADLVKVVLLKAAQTM